MEAHQGDSGMRIKQQGDDSNGNDVSSRWINAYDDYKPGPSAFFLSTDQSHLKIRSPTGASYFLILEVQIIEKLG
jgi:hypothetical protein